MINVNQVASQLARMPDKALQQFAAMHKDDPYTLSMALSESNRRKQMRAGAQAQGGEQPKVVDQVIQGMGPEQAPQQPMPQEPQEPQPAQAGRQLPEEQGIGALPAPNMQGMADGGIVGYAARGAVKAEDPLAQYEPMIRAEAARQGIDPEVAMRLFRQESGGQKDVVSAKGAVGLGQLMPAAAKEMGLKPEERKDPAKNIPASIGYFKKQLDRFGTYDKAAAAYNWGPGNVEKHITESVKKNRDFRVGLPKETAGYLTAVVPVATARAEDGISSLIKKGTTGKSDLLSRPGDKYSKSDLLLRPGDKFGTILTGTKPTTPAAPLGGRDVPGSPEDIAYQAQLKAERGPEKSYLAQRGQELLGAPEALASLVTGAFSPATGAARAGIDRLLGGDMSVEEGARRMTYAPRFEAGQESLSQAHRALEDFKVPPYIPGATTSRSRLRAPAAVRAAEAAAQKAREVAAQAEAAQASAARRSGPAQGELFTKEQAPIPNKPVAKTPLNEAMQKAVEDNRRAEQMSLFTEAEAPVPSALDRVLKKRDPALEAAQSAAEKRARGAEDVRSAREAVEQRRQLEANREALKAQERAKKAKDEAIGKETKAVEENILDRVDRRYDAEQAARAAVARKVLPAAEVGANVEPFSELESPPVSDVYPDEMLRGIKPSAAADTTEVPIEERSRFEPKAEAKKGSGFSDEDMLMLGLNLMAGKSQYALSNLGEAGIATLGAKREREKLAAAQQERNIMGEYYKRLSGTLGTSAEERMIARVMQEEGIPYAQAIERISGAKFAPRAETTERDFMKQYESLAKTPGFLIDNPDAAAWVQNQMRMRGLTTSGSSSLTNVPRFLGYEGQQ